MNDKAFYEEIGKINESLDELAREVKGEEQRLNEIEILNETVNNEVVNTEVVNNENVSTEVTDVEVVNNEVVMPVVEAKEVNEDLNKEEKSGKGQIILIVILSIALVAVLASMIYFVNSL